MLTDQVIARAFNMHIIREPAELAALLSLTEAPLPSVILADDHACIAAEGDDLLIGSRSTRWIGHTPRLTVAEPVVRMRRPATLEALPALAEALDAARAAHVAGQITCVRCAKQFIPAHTVARDDGRVCHECASRDFGVIF